MKQHENYLTSGEFCKLCGITKNTLIWYVRKGLLKPKLTEENGYHYYSLEQFYEYDVISALKWADYSLNEIKSFLSKRTPEEMSSFLQKQHLLMESRIEAMQHQLKVSRRTLNEYYTIQSRYHAEPRMIHLEPIHMITYPIEGKTERDHLYALRHIFDLYHVCAKKYGITCSMSTGLIVNQEQIREEDWHTPEYVAMRVDQAFPDPSYREIKADFCAVAYHQGSIAEIGTTYRKLIEMIRDQSALIAGDAFEYEYINHFSTNDPEEYVREIIIPCKKKG